MKLTAVKTTKLRAPQDELWPVLHAALNSLPEKSILCIASKVVAIDQGRVIPLDKYEADKDTYIIAEAERTLPRRVVPGGAVMHTITDGTLAASAGIDRSNGNNYAVLWPRKPSTYAKQVRQRLMKEYDLQHFAVIITDSRSQPLRYGTTGYAIGGAGINPFVSYAHTDDLFGRPFDYQRANVYDGIAAAAVVEMGEGSESTPLVIVEDLPTAIEFSDTALFSDIKVPLESDIFWPLLKDFS